MGKFKFIFLLILALVLVCGVVMVAEAPTSFDDSLTLIPTDASDDVNSSNCENGTCLINESNDNSTKETVKKESQDDKINYDSKYYEGSYIEGLYFCNDLEHAFKDAKAHHRNVMIVFDGAACIYCEYLKEDTLTDSAVQKEINDNYIILITETGQSPELSSQLNIYGTPTTVIFDENGNELGRIEEYEPPEEYLANLKEISGK